MNPCTAATKGNADGEVTDVTVPEFDFSMPWNSRKVGTTWAIDDRGIKQVGCIHTSQGLEFDYVGVIVGADLSFNPVDNTYFTDHKKYKDKTGKKGMKDKPEELNKLVRNIYKVLMTRGMKGCYVYFVDKEIETYFKTALSKHKVEKESKVVIQEEPVISPYSRPFVNVPLYDSIGCGDMMFADTTVQEMYPVPAHLISKGAKYFVLRTAGDSMNELSINDGDYILCKKNYHPENGEIVVAVIGVDAVLKELQIEKESILLKPRSTNLRHQPIRLVEGDEFQIQGVYLQKLTD